MSQNTVKIGELQEYPAWEPPEMVPEDWEFRYKQADEAPQRHHRVMEMARCLLNAETIAEALGFSVTWVEKVMDHPPNRHQLDEIQFHYEHIQQIAAMSMGEIIIKGVEYGKGVMEDPKSSHHQKMDVLKFAVEHHPEGTFAKRSKVEQTHTHLVQSEGQLRGLLESADAAKRELERDRARAIDVPAADVENLLDEGET